MKVCADSNQTGCMMLLADDAPSRCCFCDPNHAPNPQPGTIIDRDDIPVVRGMYGRRYPITAKCITCYEPIGCADGTADWSHLDDRYAGYLSQTERVGA